MATAEGLADGAATVPEHRRICHAGIPAGAADRREPPDRACDAEPGPVAAVPGPSRADQPAGGHAGTGFAGSEPVHAGHAAAACAEEPAGATGNDGEEG